MAEKPEDPSNPQDLLTQLAGMLANQTAGYRVIESTKLPLFSGTPKDANFETYEYEVKCLVREGVSQDHIKQAIRRSLKGEAARVLHTLGETPTVDQILTKLKGIYGPVQTGALLLQSFWSEKQKDDESAAAWGCRLEDQMQLLKEKKQVEEREASRILCTKFWSGLRSSKLKDATRYRYETTQDFDELRVSVRSIEQEYQEDKDTHKARVHTTTADAGLSDLVKKLLKRIDELEEQVKQPKVNQMKFEVRKETMRQPNSAPGKHYGKNEQGDYICNRCGLSGHISKGCKASLN